MLILNVHNTLKKSRVLLVLKCKLAQHFNFFNVCALTLRYCEVRDNLIDKKLSYFSGFLIFQNTAVYFENDQLLFCPSSLKFIVPFIVSRNIVADAGFRCDKATVDRDTI